jgi:hypothetical protein
MGIERMASKIQLSNYLDSPFTFLYTNNDAHTTVISARILRIALHNGTLWKNKGGVYLFFKLVE